MVILLEHFEKYRISGKFAKQVSDDYLHAAMRICSLSDFLIVDHPTSDKRVI